MINKYIFLYITFITAGAIDIYGVLEQNEMKNFTVETSFRTNIYFLSFQGPIKFAKVSEDGNLIELQPIPETYFFYDFLQENPQNKMVKYVAYGSNGGATFPQYVFSEYWFYVSLTTSYVHQSLLMTYKNLSVQYRSQKGYLILDIPMIVMRNGSFIQQESFLINIGYEEDKELLKLGKYIRNDNNSPQNYTQQRHNSMTFSNYYTTVYIKMDQKNNYNYFAVICENSNLRLGGSTFAITYLTTDSNTWIWILVTSILILLMLVTGCYLKQSKRNYQHQYKQSNFQQSYQQFN